MPKYYIAKLIGLKQDFVFKGNGENIRKAIFNAPKNDYGNFIFVKTISGYKEIITGKRFGYQWESTSVDGYPNITVPTNTGIFVDKNTAREIPKEKEKEKLEEYYSKINKDQLIDYFEEIQKESNAVLEHASNKTPYYVAKLVGLKEDFTHNPNGDVSYSVYMAPKNNYGEYIFAKTVGGYKELLTGRFFKYINDGFAAGPYYEAPKNSGLMVDRRTEKEIPKSELEEKVDKYKQRYNEEELLNFFAEIQRKCDQNLLNGITNDKNITFGPKK